jgi:asparagine synthase (glutamine-hydrolysing)
VSGILGIWHRDGRPVDRSIVSAMDAQISGRGTARAITAANGALALVQHLHPLEQAEAPPHGPSCGASIVYDGRLDNRDEVIDALSLPADISDAGCLLAAYGKWGAHFAGRLVGDFAAALYDGDERRLLLVRDCIGVRPLYYVQRGGLFAFASEIKALVAHPDIAARPDEDGLADFLLFASRPIDRQDITCFRAISAVVPAHVVVASRDRVTSERYWDFDGGVSLRRESFDDLVDGFRERFERAVARRIRSAGAIAVSVSGGFDSSSIFCQAARLQTNNGSRPSLHGISYYGGEGTDADERRYLTDLERAHDVRIDRFAMQPLQGVVAGAAEQVRAIEAPFIDPIWGITSELHRRAAEGGATTLLTGHWGDQVLFSSAYLADVFRAGRGWAVIRRHLREYARWFGDAEARSLARRFFVDLGRAHLPAALLPAAKRLRRRLSGADQRQRSWFSRAFLDRALLHADEPVKLPQAFHSAHARDVYLEARSKYHVHCLEWNNKVAALYGLDAAFPFLDRDLLQFLMAAPGEEVTKDGAPRGLAREAMRGLLPEPVRTRTWKANFTSAVNDGVAGDADELTSLLTSRSLVVQFGYVEPGRLAAAVQRLGAAARSDDCVVTWALADLVGLEMWLREYIAPDPAARSAATASHTSGSAESLRL